MPATTIITVAPAGGPVAELVRTVLACADIGAGVVDVPAAETVVALRDRTDLVVRGPGPAEVTSCPLGDWDRAVELHETLREREVVPAYESSEPGQLKMLQRLLDRHGLPYGGKVHCDLRGLRTVPELAATMEALPPGATFTASGAGPAALPMMLAALAAGGHLRVELADNPRDNVQLVARAAGLARIAQRLPASAAEARALLGIGT
jgi:beta-keto acid cleavage enzyme